MCGVVWHIIIIIIVIIVVIIIIVIICVVSTTQGWERDDLLRITAKLGEPSDTHTIYEHVDVLIHPLGVHLNEGIAVEVWVRVYLAAWWFSLLSRVKGLHWQHTAC